MMQLFRQSQDLIGMKKHIKERISAIDFQKSDMDGTFNKLMKNNLKKMGKEHEEGKYMAMLNILLPESITKSNLSFKDLNTNVFENSLNDYDKGCRIFDIFSNIGLTTRAKRNIAGFNVVRGDSYSFQNLQKYFEEHYRTASDADKVSFLQLYDESYKKAVYEVCRDLIRDEEIYDKIYDAINDYDIKSTAKSKIYFEALFNYILSQFVQQNIEIGNYKIYDSGTAKQNILFAIDVVKKISRGDKLTKNAEKNLYKELQKFTVLSERKSSIDINESWDIDNDVVERAGYGLIDVEDKLNNLSLAFDNMQASPDGTSHPNPIPDNKTFSKKNDVVKKLREVSKKILSSGSASDELVKKFLEEKTIGETIEKTFHTPQSPNRPSDVRNTILTAAQNAANMPGANQRTVAEAVKSFGASNVVISDANNATNAGNAITAVNNRLETLAAEYYRGMSANLSQDSKDMLKGAIANRALKDKAFRDRLDEEIKAKIESSPTYFSGGGAGELDIGSIAGAGHPFGNAPANDALCDDTLGNVYTKGEPHIAHEKAMNYIEEFYVKDVERRLNVFGKAGELQEKEETKWLGEVIVDFRPGFWLEDKQFDELRDDIVEYSQQIFNLNFNVDDELKKEIIIEIIKSINEKSLKIRQIVDLKEITRDVFNRVAGSLIECQSNDDVKEVKKKYLKNILDYKRDAGDDADKNNFIKVAKAIIINWAHPTNPNIVLPGGGAIPQPHQNVKKIYDGYDEISKLLLLNISDKREFVETSRAFAGMVKYICNGDGTWDDKTDRFNKFSSFVKECLAKDNTQEIIDYAKMHLKEFVLVEAAAATNMGPSEIAIAGANSTFNEAIKVLFETSAQLNDEQASQALVRIGTEGDPNPNTALDELVIGKTKRVKIFVSEEQDAAVLDDASITKYIALKRLSDGLKFFLAGDVEKFKECLLFTSNDDIRRRYIGSGGFQSIAVGKHEQVAAGAMATALTANDHGLLKAMYGIVNNQEILKKIFSFRKADATVVPDNTSPTHYSSIPVSNGQEADSADNARQLVMQFANFSKDDVLKAIKILDDDAKRWMPQISEYLCAMNTPSNATVNHATNANNKIHMITLPFNTNIYVDTFHKHLAPFKDYKDDGVPIDNIDKDLLLNNGISPTSLFFQHNKSIGKSSNNPMQFEITENAEEIINPIVRKIVLYGISSNDNQWWKVADVGKLNKFVERYNLTEKDVDELFKSCPFLLSSFDFDIFEQYLTVVYDNLKDAPDLRKNYQKQLSHVCKQISDFVMKHNFDNDSNVAARIANSRIKKAVMNLITKGKNAHQLYAVADKLKSASAGNKMVIFDNIADGKIFDTLPALNTNVSAKQTIKVKKNGKKYELNILKTKMDTDPKKDGKNDVRRKFLDKNSSYESVFDKIGDEYQTYLSFDEKGNTESTGKIVIFGKLDEYGIRHIKELPFKDNEADFSSLKEKYESDKYDICIDVDGRINVNGKLITTLNSNYAKQEKEFLQVICIWKDIFDIKDEHTYREVIGTIRDCCDNGKVEKLLSALMKLKKNIRKTQYQDVIRLIKDDSYENIKCPLDENRVKMIVELIKFKRDFIIDNSADKQLCDDLIEKIHMEKGISLRSRSDCKKLFSFINPFALCCDDVNFFKGYKNFVDKKYNFDKGGYLKDGIFKKKKPKQEKQEDNDNDDEKIGSDEKKEEEKEEEKEEIKSDSVDDGEEMEENKKKDKTHDDFNDDDEEEEAEEDKLSDEKQNSDLKNKVDKDDDDIVLDHSNDKTQHTSILDDFGIKDDFGGKRQDVDFQKKNKSSADFNIVDIVERDIRNQIKNKIARNNKNHFQNSGNIAYSNPQGRRQYNLGGNINNSSGNMFNQYVNQKQDDITKIRNTNFNNQRLQAGGGTLLNTFKKNFITPRRQAFFFKKQQEQNNQIWQKGNTNLLRPQMVNYGSNRSMNGMYDGFRTQTLNNSLSAYNQRQNVHLISTGNV